MILESFVTSIVAAIVYDTGKSIVKEVHSSSQEKELKKSLNQYLTLQMSRYGEEGTSIIEAIPLPKWNGQIYRELIASGADCDYVLNRYMQDSDIENYDKIRATSRGCIDIIVQHIKQWPEFLPDIAIVNRKTLKEISTNTKENQRLLLDLKMETTRIHNTNVVQDRTIEYKEKWIEPLFLNDPSKYRDTKTICLEDIHIPHHYIYNNGPKSSNQSLMDELAGCGGHLVQGDPGIGKSSLISWYLNKSNDYRVTLVYRLTDFELTGLEKQPGTLLLERAHLKSDQLQDTIIFLDGLDECGFPADKRALFLRELYSNWNHLKRNNVSWIVTCRINYIPEEHIRSLRIPIITLLPLDLEQIEQFLQKYENTVGQSIPENKRTALLSKKNTGKHGSPFGIPLILYMAASPDISVSEDSTLVDVYDQLFPAIYQRSSSYDTHEQEIVFRLHEEIHQMSRDIALWMLLHNSNAASIMEHDYKEIEKSFGGDIVTEHVHQIGSYLRTMPHTEGKAEVCFIHRTMYEYFVADGFIHRAIQANTLEELSGVIAWYWHSELMEDTMQQYVREKMRKNKDALKFSLWEKAGKRIIEKGAYRCWSEILGRSDDMNYRLISTCLYPHNNENLAEDRKSENTVFWNLCHFLAWIRNINCINISVYNKQKRFARVLSQVIRHCSADYFPVYCPFFSLSYASLSRTSLVRAILNNADLSHAHLTDADLSGANLFNADLTDINVKDAILTGVLLSRRQVQKLGYNIFKEWRFESIKIGNTLEDITEYSRRQFFDSFFPNKPFPKNKK